MVKTKALYIKTNPTYVGKNHHCIWFLTGLVDSIFANNFNDNMSCSVFSNIIPDMQS